MSKIKVLTLGGCVTHHIGKLSSNLYPIQVSHHWRRPTIAFTSRPVRGIKIHNDVNPAITKYILEDMQKTQLASFASSIDSDSIILIEFTREILTGVYKKEDTFFTCPYSLISVEENFEWADSPKLEDGNKYIEQGCEHLDFLHPQFYWYWQTAFTKFMQVCHPAKKVIIMATSFTNYFFTKNGRANFGDQGWVDKANDMLDRMYAYASRFENIEFISPPKFMQISATEVIYGGPTHTHIIDEALNWILLDLIKKIGLNTINAENWCLQQNLNRTESYFNVKAQLLEREPEIANLNQLIHDKDHHINNLQLEISRLSQILQEKDTHIGSINQQLLELDNLNHLINKNNEKLRNQKDRIINSSAWKMTKPFRSIKSFIQ